MRISDWSSDVCSSDLLPERAYLVLRRMHNKISTLGQVDRRQNIAYALCKCRTPIYEHRYIGAQRPCQSHQLVAAKISLPKPVQGDQDRKSTRVNSSP